MAFQERSAFYVAVESVFKGWTALQLAVANGFGGVHSQEKALWMIEAVEQWFSENSDIYADELEEFLADVMNTEFDTVTEDGSLSEIAQKICGFYQLYKTGRNEEIFNKIQTCPQASIAQSLISKDDNEDDQLEAESIDEDVPMETNDTCTNPSQNGQQQQPAPSEDDEWTTVPSRRNRKK
ncbi:pre-rRNA-processing protein TSR2 homolog [Tubulanus polymorphus]|uniref:pre-rRNA-processing protein TSR2 homolog n=1 Tax=Tubulanus polymorphus TaxID=672921 RepID=UPI003DA57FED